MANSNQIVSVSQPWHYALAEFFILFPEKSMSECAEHFKVSTTWLSLVKNSDAFKDFFEARRREHSETISEAIAAAAITDKLTVLAELSVDAVTKKVEEHIKAVSQPGHIPGMSNRELSLEALQDSANLALKALGFGPAKVQVNATQVNNYQATLNSQAVDRARGRLTLVRQGIDRQLETEKANAPTSPRSDAQVIDGTSEHVVLPGAGGAQAAA